MLIAVRQRAPETLPQLFKQHRTPPRVASIKSDAAARPRASLLCVSSAGRCEAPLGKNQSRQPLLTRAGELAEPGSLSCVAGRNAGTETRMHQIRETRGSPVACVCDRPATGGSVARSQGYRYTGQLCSRCSLAAAQLLLLAAARWLLLSCSLSYSLAAAELLVGRY